jgi:long-subunit acyl-CoA synthetase (AMP-forming)
MCLNSSLGEGAIEYIIGHADVSFVIVSKQNLKSLLKSLPKLPGVTHLIQYDVDDRYHNVEETVSDDDVAKAKEHNVTLVGYSAAMAYEIICLMRCL